MRVVDTADSLAKEPTSMIDWHRLVLNLRGAGLTYTQIARASGVGRGTIANLATHRQRTVTFEDGLRLLDCHYDRCPAHHAQIRIEKGPETVIAQNR